MVVLLGITSAQQLATSYAPFADAIRPLFGEAAAGIIAASAALSCFGTLNGWILLQGQVPLAAARDGLFPKAFGRISVRGIPLFGLVVSSIIITVLLLLNYQANLVEQFTLLVTFTTFAILLPYLYSSLADLLFLAQNRHKLSLLAWLRPLVVALLAFSYSLWVIAGVGKEVVYFGTLFIFGGLPLYAWMKRS
jgi:APA family basic amino acid/polyamine antiporter